MKRKILRGYVENKTKEAALAAMMLALFFVARTNKIVLVPGALLIDFSAIPIYTAASLLSWPYTAIFAFSNLYLSSNMFGSIAMFIGSQVVFLLSRTVKEEWIGHIVVSGCMVSLPIYGLLMHFAGLMNFRLYLTLYSIPSALFLVTTYFGGVLIWTVLRRFI